MILTQNKLRRFVIGQKVHLRGVQFEQILKKVMAKKVYKIVPSSVR
jgi:hypothetical protein